MRPTAWYWPAAIVGLLVASAAANIGLMVIANRDPSFAVEPDYYRKAVDWDRTMAQSATNAELGWRAAARIEARPDGGALLVVHASDRAGGPITGATVEVEAFPSARAREVRSAVLRPSGDGTYTIDLARARPGLWELRVAITHGPHRFTQTLAPELAHAGPVRERQAAGSRAPGSPPSSVR